MGESAAQAQARARAKARARARARVWRVVGERQSAAGVSWRVASGTEREREGEGERGPGRCEALRPGEEREGQW